jgi:surface polysaccharide O-acyltransferase-like enzyme
MKFLKPLVAALIFALSSFGIFYLTGVFSLQKGELFGAFYDYSSPLVFIQAVSIFLFFKSLDGAKAFWYVAKLAPLVFGVYLVHPIILEYSSFVSDLTLKALFVFFVSLGIVRILCYSGLKRFL